MPVANVPTTRLLSAVEVRVDAQRSACASRRGGRTRRADAGSAPRRCGEPASDSLCAPVGGRGALRDSRDRLLPSTTVDGSSALWSSIRFVSGRIGGSLSLFCHSKDSSGTTLTVAAMRAGANRLPCPFRACGELTPTERRAAAPQPSPAIRTRASPVRLGSGGTHSGQLCPYPRSPRVGTLLGMCNDQVAPALTEPAPHEYDEYVSPHAPHGRRASGYVTRTPPTGSERCP
jgi:hypothetical protein